MAKPTKIDSNQLVKQHEEQQNISQLLSPSEQEKATTGVATEISPITTATKLKLHNIEVETLEQQLLIELNSGDKKNNKKQNKMELRQIELIYRAEGNANLVLALPQFKKVLRLPKSEKPMIQLQQQQLELQSQQSMPHVVAKANIVGVKEEEAEEEEVEEDKEKIIEKEDQQHNITMQYQNTSASSVVHQNAKG